MRLIELAAWPKTGQKGRVLHALLIREMMQRYGHSNIGFLWLVGEPLLLTIGVMVMWSVINGPQKHGVNILPLVLTGYSMLTLWRHMVNRSMRAFSNSADLLFHRSIKPIDIYFSQQILEIFGCLSAFFIAYIPLALLGIISPIDDYLILLGGWFLLSFWGFGFGLILASLTELSETVQRFVQPIMYLTIPLTGVFYMVAWLPKKAQLLVTWSPMVQASEMLRAGYFGPSIPTHYDAGYLFITGLVANAIGLAMVSRATKSIDL